MESTGSQSHTQLKRLSTHAWAVGKKTTLTIPGQVNKVLPKVSANRRREEMHTKTQTKNHGTKTPWVGTQDNEATQGTKEKQCLDLPLRLPCYHFLGFSISWTKKKGCVCACVCVCTCSVVFSCVQFFVASWIVVCQAPLSMEFSRQECWSRLPFPTPGDLPDPSLLHHVHWQADSSPQRHVEYGTWLLKFFCYL